MTVPDRAFERLKFELVKQGYTCSEMEALAVLLCDIRHVLLGRATMCITPMSLQWGTRDNEWVIFPQLTIHDLQILVGYAKDPGSADFDFIRVLLGTDMAVEILDTMAQLYAEKSGTPPRVRPVEKREHLQDAKTLLNCFSGFYPHVIYYEY